MKEVAGISTAANRGRTHIHTNIKKRNIKLARQEEVLKTALTIQKMPDRERNREREKETERASKKKTSEANNSKKDR